MNIAYLSDSIVPSKSANSVHVISMVDAFNEIGINCRLFAYGNGLDQKEIFEYYHSRNEFPIILNNFNIPKIGTFIHAFLNVRRLTRKETVFGRSIYSVWLASRFGFNVFLEMHDPYLGLTGVQQALLRSLFKSKRFKGLMVISHVLKELLLEQVKILRAEDILVVHDGATVRTHASGENLVLKGRTGRLNIGYVGTASKGRGIELICSCAEALPQYNFHLVGVSFEDLTALGLKDTVRLDNLFCYGFVSPIQASDIRKSCDVLMAPYQNRVMIRSNKDTASYMSPLKIFEYMADEKAIIASDIPAIRSILGEDNALLVNPEVKSEWITAINSLAENKSFADRLAKNAYEELVEKYTWDKRAQRIQEFIKRKL